MKIHHIAITVNNLEESVDFYTSFFGFEVVKKFAREDMGAHATFIRLGDFQIELWHFQDMKDNLNPLDDIKVRGIRHIALAVKNLEETLLELKENGLKFSEPRLGASGHYYAFTSDPNGVALEIYQE